MKPSGQLAGMKWLRWYLPLAIVIATINLRPGLLTLGPVLPAVQRALDLSPLAAGMLTALPILALGLASALAVPLGLRLGWNGGLLFALLLTGSGIVLRSTGTESMLFAGAALLGVGIGIGNVLVPTLVKARLANHIGLAMGIYTMSLAAGALASSTVTPLLLARFGDWKPTLAIWAIPAFIAAAVTLPTLIDNIRPQRRRTGTPLHFSKLAWAVATYMGLQSALFYSVALWLGALMTARGMPLPDLAIALTLFYFTQFLSALVVPILLTKSKRQDIVAAALVAAVGAIIVATLYGPLSIAYLTCGLLGIAMGGVFAAALTFQVIRARTHDTAARLSSMAQCFGYIIASIGPLVLGLVSKWPDARLASTIWLLLLVAITMVAGALAGRPGFVDDEIAGVAPVPAN
jgi:CP family cyanate transporter-like MFS transporter